MSAPTEPAKVDGGSLGKKETPNGTTKKEKNNKDADKKEVRDAKNKMKFHSTKMDLNLKILREEMSSLADTGNSLSRQMASMYRTLKQVKDDEEGEGGGGGEDEDTYTDDPESEPDIDSTSARRSYEALDTEDDVNKMSDLDSESCSFAGRKNRNTAKDSGLVKSPKRLQVCDNRNANEMDDEKTPQPSSDLQFTYPNSGNASDPHITPMSLTLTSTDNDNNVHHDHHHHHDHDHERHNPSDSESDDESLPDTSSDECSRCLCCSSLASYQNIPWRIQRRDSATTTEASDSSEYCSDSDEEGHRRVPLYAKFNPFFFQEYASGDEGDEETDECEKMDEDADSLPEQTRMSPLGRESSPARVSKENPKQETHSPGQQSLPVKEGKVAEKTETRPPEVPSVEDEPDEQSSASVIEKIQRMQTRIAEETKDVQKNKRESKDKKKSENAADKSNFLSPNAPGASGEASKPEVKKKPKVPTPEKKEKQKHISKSHMFIVAPPTSGEHKGKKMVLTHGGEEPMFEIPASCIDKEGKVTLRPDPKLAPEAYKAGKTITFQVKHTPDGVVATDGPMLLTTNPKTTRTILRVRSSQPSTPTTPTNTKSSVEVTPEGIINIRKRRTVPVRINPVQAVPMVTPFSEDAHSCTHCTHHRQTVTSPQQQSTPQLITRRVTHHTTVTPVYGSSGNQPIMIHPQGMMAQPNQHVIISNQGGMMPQTQQQHIIIGPQGGQQSQIIVSPQPVQQRPIQTISVTPSGHVMNQGAPIIYQTNQGTPAMQSFQIGSSHVQQPTLRLGGPSQTMSVRVGNNETFSVPVQGRQPGEMRFVINQ